LPALQAVLDADSYVHVLTKRDLVCLFVYDKCLKILNLERLELRRIWSYLLWCYKIVFWTSTCKQGGIFHVKTEQNTRSSLHTF